MKAIFIRHGKTKGNMEGRYIGITDEPLSPCAVSELREKKYPGAERIIVSPMKRCIETAKIIYDQPFEIYSDLRECNFGDFENKNYDELKKDPYYIKWLESKGKLPFPNGETHEQFCMRTQNCFENILKSNKSPTVAFIVHGGTIMSILQKYFGGEFYDYQIKNGEYICSFIAANGG